MPVRGDARTARSRPLRPASHWDRVVADPIDPHLEQVTFYSRTIGSSPRLPWTAGGQPRTEMDDRQMRVPYGDWIAYQPALLAVLCALFVVMAGVSPWRRLRNLDVAAALSLLVSVVLFQHRYMDPSVLAAVPGWCTCCVRCAGKALGARRESRRRRRRCSPR